ncbi:MAG: hypothetical protein SFV20_03240 [Sphingopyxis sp.]|nr:hypothetical protein [Sphingopyxis sp.]
MDNIRSNEIDFRYLVKPFGQLSWTVFGALQRLQVSTEWGIG